MTDQTAADPAAPPPLPAVPIQVKDKAARVVVPELVSSALMIAAGLAVDHVAGSDLTPTLAATALPVIIAGACAFAWRLRKRIGDWFCMKVMASHLPDRIAYVGKK